MQFRIVLINLTVYEMACIGGDLHSPSASSLSCCYLALKFGSLFVWAVHWLN